MRYGLYDFQEDAVAKLAKKMLKMQRDWHEDGEKSSVALTAPTGAGKTIICAAIILIENSTGIIVLTVWKMCDILILISEMKR